MKLFFFVAAILLLWSCKKEHSKGQYRIQGRLLESSSNPVPVRNYKMSIYQRDARSLFCNISGVTLQGNTDNSGFFSFDYDGIKGTGFCEGSYNRNTFSLSGGRQ